MKVNLFVPVLDLDGNEIKGQKGESLIISKQIGNSLYQNLDKEDPLASYELAKKVYHSTGEIDLTASELEKIKARIKENFIVGFTGQALEIIANADNPKPIGGGGGGSAKPPKDE